MIKHLTKVGNSNAIILDKAILELVGLDEGGDVQVQVSGGSIVLTPVTGTSVDPESFERALDRVVAERRDVLRRLAE